jgi:hypothetical protein
MKKSSAHRQPMRRLVFVLVVVAFIIIGALGVALTTRIVDRLPDSTVVIGPDFAAEVNPLTGQRVSDPAVLRRRPLAVKISNGPATVRPQAGIGDADLVFEHVTEGDITRFTAIFLTHTPPRAGSIRSARLIDLELAVMYRAVFAFSGASNGVRDKIFASSFRDRALEGVSVGSPTFYRDDSIDAPHNMFTDPTALWDIAQQRGLSATDTLRGMQFSAAPTPGGAAVTTITVDYGPTVAEWRYDPASGRYLRWSDGEPHLDANASTRVSAANVVILRAWHQLDYNIVESEWQGVKSYSMEIHLWTFGPAIVCRDGQCITGRWHRRNKADLLTFWTADDRQPIYLKPGNTWFQVINLPNATEHQQQIALR